MPDLITRLQKLLSSSSLRNYPLKTSIFLYTISWGWLYFIRDSIWSDDWDLFAFRKNTSYNFELYGFAPWRDIDFFLYELFGAQSLKALTFLSFFFSSIFVYGIQSKIPSLNLTQRRLIAVLFLILPFNSSRISMMVFAYTIAYFCFFLAWYLLVVFDGPKIKMLCLILFFLSFQMHSMLFFYCVPVAHYLFLSRLKVSTEFYSLIRTNFILITLPIAYLISRAVMWPSKNGYHKVDLLEMNYLTFIALSSTTVFAIYSLRKMFDISIRTINLIVSGLLLLMITTLPYVIYRVYRGSYLFIYDYAVIFFGRQGWDSRHQTLQPLGAAFLTVGIVSLVPEALKKLKSSFVALVLLTSILMNLTFGFEAFTEFSKHLSVIDHIEAKRDYKQVQQYIVQDETQNLNFLNNQYSAKQWAGLIATATDDSIYSWFDIIPGVGTSKRLVIGCQISDEMTLNSDAGLSRLILIRGPASRWRALKNFLSSGEIGFVIQVIDSNRICST